MPTPLNQRGVIYAMPIPEAEQHRTAATAALYGLIESLVPAIGQRRANDLTNATIAADAAQELETVARLVAVLSATVHTDADVFVAPETTCQSDKLERTVGTTNRQHVRRPWRAYSSPWAWLTLSSTIAAIASMRRASWRGRVLLSLPIVTNLYTAWLMRPGDKRGRLRQGAA